MCITCQHAAILKLMLLRSAVTIDDCTTYQNCTLSIFTGYTGSDRHGNTFTTATQIHQINRYSAATLYNNLKSGVRHQQPSALSMLFLDAALVLLCVCTQHAVQQLAIELQVLTS